MPQYLGSGSHEYEGTKYRFVVLERYGTDIWKLFLENDRIFPTDTVFKLGIQIASIVIFAFHIVLRMKLFISYMSWNTYMPKATFMQILKDLIYYLERVVNQQDKFI